MPRKISSPVRVPVGGQKQIEEYVGRISTQTGSFSIAHMVAPPEWSEPFQRPEFAEATIVTRGILRVEHDARHTDVARGEVILVEAGERVRYSNPFEAECEYFAVCVPAFADSIVNREA